MLGVRCFREVPPVSSGGPNAATTSSRVMPIRTRDSSSSGDMVALWLAVGKFRAKTCYDPAQAGDRHARTAADPAASSPSPGKRSFRAEPEPVREPESPQPTPEGKPMSRSLWQLAIVLVALGTTTGHAANITRIAQIGQPDTCRKVCSNQCAIRFNTCAMSCGANDSCVEGCRDKLVACGYQCRSQCDHR